MNYKCASSSPGPCSTTAIRDGASCLRCDCAPPRVRLTSCITIESDDGLCHGPLTAWSYLITVLRSSFNRWLKGEAFGHNSMTPVIPPPRFCLTSSRAWRARAEYLADSESLDRTTGRGVPVVGGSGSFWVRFRARGGCQGEGVSRSADPRLQSGPSGWCACARRILVGRCRPDERQRIRPRRRSDFCLM